MIDFRTALEALHDYSATQAQINNLLRGPGLMEPNRKAKRAMMLAQAMILQAEYYVRGMKRGCFEPLEIPGTDGA